MFAELAHEAVEFVRVNEGREVRARRCRSAAGILAMPFWPFQLANMSSALPAVLLGPARSRFAGLV